MTWSTTDPKVFTLPERLTSAQSMVKNYELIIFSNWLVFGFVCSETFAEDPQIGDAVERLFPQRGEAFVATLIK